MRVRLGVRLGVRVGVRVGVGARVRVRVRVAQPHICRSFHRLTSKSASCEQRKGSGMSCGAVGIRQFCVLPQ